MGYKYLVHDTLDHDGKRYEEGDLVELDKDQAANLVRHGVVSATPAEMADDSDKTASAKGMVVLGGEELVVAAHSDGNALPDQDAATKEGGRKKGKATKAEPDVGSEEAAALEDGGQPAETGKAPE